MHRRVFTHRAETDESNYSGRQTALLQQDRLQLRDASSFLISIIHLTCKGKYRWLAGSVGLWKIEMAVMMKLLETA